MTKRSNQMMPIGRAQDPEPVERRRTVKLLPMTRDSHLRPIIALSLLFVGCMTSVSTRPPFKEYLGRALTTQRTTILYPDRAWSNSGAMLFSQPQKVLYLAELPPASDDRNKHRVAIIPPGQSVRLLEIRRQAGDGDVSYDAIGEIYVPAWKRFVRFHHYWGYNNRLDRAPWDSASVPITRSL